MIHHLRIQNLISSPASHKDLRMVRLTIAIKKIETVCILNTFGVGIDHIISYLSTYANYKRLLITARLRAVPLFIYLKSPLATVKPTTT